MNTDRPVNSNLLRFHFPVMAILSICHRISGVILFLFLPLIFYLLHQTTLSETAFERIQQLLAHNHWMQFAVWLVLSAALFHLLAGLRHLAMDLGFWESVQEGRISTYTVFVLSLIVIILVGVWIW